MSSTSDLYEFNMYLFDHVDLEEFLLLILNFNMTIEATWTLDMDAKIQYLRPPFRKEELRQFDLLSADVENTETLNVDYYIKCLAVHLFPVNYLLKSAMRRRMKKLRSLKVRRLAARLIDLN